MTLRNPDPNLPEASKRILGTQTKKKKRILGTHGAYLETLLARKCITKNVSPLCWDFQYHFRAMHA